jgi:hypothetical protein
MEYLIGGVTAFIVLLTISFFMRNQAAQPVTSIRYSQTHIFELIKNSLPTNNEILSVKPTQARKHNVNTYTRIIFVNKKAYWIKDNNVYEAEVINGDVIKETAKQVDIMTMDKVQLNNIMFIIDKLTEGNINDSGYSG